MSSPFHPSILWILGRLGLLLLLTGCQSTPIAIATLEPVPPDEVWIHGYVDRNSVAAKVVAVDGQAAGWFEAFKPVVVTPGEHRLDLEIQPIDTARFTRGWLEDVLVKVEAGHRYRVRFRVWLTDRNQEALDVWIEDDDTNMRVSEVFTVWPLRVRSQ